MEAWPIALGVPLLQLQEEGPLRGVEEKLRLEGLNEGLPANKRLFRGEQSTKCISYRHDGVLDGNRVREVPLRLPSLAFEDPCQEVLRFP